MSKKISVIVPAYNVEKYIGKCVRSIIRQTYKNIEIIIVDDGSTDKTGKICDELAKIDERIIVIHQENQGLSQARNNGIKAATGEIISLVDGDDIVCRDFLQDMIVAMHDDVDIVIGGYKTIGDHNNTLHVAHCNEGLMAGKEATIKLLTQQEDVFVIAWNKLYKKSLFAEYDIWYPAGKIHEDNLTTYKLLSKARKVAIVDTADYLYVKRAGSITCKSKKEQQVREKINAAKEAVEFFEDGDLREAAVYSLFLSRIIELNEAIRAKKTDAYKGIISEILSLKPAKNKYCSAKCKVYVVMLKSLSGKPYIAFRKVIDGML